MSGNDGRGTGANDAVAGLFEEYADRLEAQGDDYRPRSYRRAAENIRECPESVDTLAAEGKDAIRTIDGVGDSIAEKIAEYVLIASFPSAASVSTDSGHSRMFSAARR